MTGEEVMDDTRDASVDMCNAARQTTRARPPLPRLRSLPNSRPSSREGSPRSAVSEAPSLATMAMARVAQYRVGPRIFKPDSSARHGLATGDIVAFRTRGVFLAAIPVAHIAADPESILHILAPSDMVDPDDRVTHLEVIRQGQWVGFRSQASGDRLLQARRRGAHRLAFFSCNLGTWEQWEVLETSVLESVPWNTVRVTLRNRRMPACELAVELVRLGTVTLMPHTALTPRSLPEPSMPEDEPIENQNIRKMSGLMVHEWLNFVDREKRKRAVLEARVEQAITDAEGLREWAASQVEDVRRDVEEEVELLLQALSNKGAALEDVQARLTTRLRWGVALLEAKKAAVLGRRVLLAWRSRASRAKYRRNVTSKLQERSSLKIGTRALQAWSDYCVDQQARQQRLRQAVRRMAALKMHSVLNSWLCIMRASKEEAAIEAEAQAMADSVARVACIRRLMGGWRERARRVKEGSRLLWNMACRSDERVIDFAFVSWRRRVSEQKSCLAAKEMRAAALTRRTLLHSALDSWRVSVEDTFGGRMQVMHAVRVMSRQRAVRALYVWRSSVVTAKADAQRWRHVESVDRRRCLAKMVVVWRDFASERRGNREMFVGFIHARADRRMLTAFAFWRAETHCNRRAAAIVEHSTRSSTVNLMRSTICHWRITTVEEKVFKHRVAVCERRRRLGTLRCILTRWNGIVQEEIGERKAVTAFLLETTRRRGTAALWALRAHAAEEIKVREMEGTAAGWHAGRLQARALWALEEATHRHREFMTSLECAAAVSDRVDLKHAWDVWQQAVGQEEAVRQAVAKFQRRRQWFAAKGAFTAWRSARSDAAAERVLLKRGVSRIAEMRMRWGLAAWLAVVADEGEQTMAALRGSRRLDRMRLTSAFDTWRKHSQRTVELNIALEMADMEGRHAVLKACLGAWEKGAEICLGQREGVLHMMQRRAFYLQQQTFQTWRNRSQEVTARKILLGKAVDRLRRLRAGQFMGAWRQQTDDGAGEAVRLSTLGLIVSQRHRKLTTRCMFATWRGRTAENAAMMLTVEAHRAAQSATTLRFAFVSWRHLTGAMVEHRERGMHAVQQRSNSTHLVKAFVGWRHVTHMSARHSLVMLHCVERVALRAMRAGFNSWRHAAQARRVRRTALVRFMQRVNRTHTAAALNIWREFAAEKVATREELERCLVRKRISFRLFRQTYWESFDEDLQATLTAMFAMESDLEDDVAGIEGSGFGGGTAARGPWPLSTSAPRMTSPSPVKSLLSSPVRNDLQKLRKEEQQQKKKHQETASAQQSVVHSELAARVQAALASAEASPAPVLPPPTKTRTDRRLGSDILAPLLHMFGDGSEGNFSLSPVPETSESTLGCRDIIAGEDYDSSFSPPFLSDSQIASSQASSVAPTAVSTPPRAATPGAGTTPFTSLSKFTTPGSHPLPQSQSFGQKNNNDDNTLLMKGVPLSENQITPAPGSMELTAGVYKMRRMTSLVRSRAAPAMMAPSGSLSSSGTPPMQENPLAALLLTSPEKENYAAMIV